MKKLLIAFSLAMAAVSIAQVDPAATVVIVNGEEIKGNEYYRRMEFLPNVGRQMGSSFATFPPGFLTIEQLITERLVMQLAKQKGVFPTDAEVQAELKHAVEDYPRLMEQWNETGRSRADLEYQFKYQLAQFKLQTQGITITDQEIDAHYKSNPTIYTIPKRVTLRAIAVAPADKSIVDSELAGGKKFEDVAKARSLDLTSSVGGAMGSVPLGTLPEGARQTIESTKIGQTTPWIDLGDQASVKYLVEGILPAETLALDARLKRQIRKELMAAKGAVRNNVLKDLSALRATAKVDIKNKEFAEAYKKFIQTYLQEQGVGSGG